MKVTPKRRRSDSAAAAVKAAQAASMGPLAPPPHVTLRPGDKPFWDAIVTARARDTWTVSDLAIAANLARSQADIERLQAEVDIEGFTIPSGNGVPIVNPKHKLLETLSRRAVSLARMLHVHAQATVGRSEDASKGLQLEKAAKVDDDDLIPTIRLVK
ncbi:P27 family phage terminase small subunit [Noviherbaspirillum galbum]|uniref:P27 family phage terminase small subunit n=1 Tax=Noviherbaspirillum galbum TaxID=2709383 RepID=A0A6B3SLN8_9BURK|nr:P27 family phage terminase small subunit [Noviherbaspirillum galbum]NEX61723.1 P27 family phage terminase small subunit [Noviherbaspirillum galbum]